MFRKWDITVQKFAKDSKKISKRIQNICEKMDEKKLKRYHSLYLEFIHKLENSVLDAHINLDNFFDSKVFFFLFYKSFSKFEDLYGESLSDDPTVSSQAKKRHMKVFYCF